MHDCYVVHDFQDLAWAVGAFALLISSRTFRSEIHECNLLLVSYATKHSCLQNWANMSLWEFIGTAAIGVIVIVERLRQFIMGSYDCLGGVRMWAGFQMAAFIFASGVLLIWIYYIQHVARGLGHMVDTFVFRFMETRDYDQAIVEWNILQAVIRKVCRCIQYGFFVMQTTAVATVLLSIGDLDATYESGEFVLLLPGAFVVIAIIRVFFLAGSVTDKCARVPALVNSLDVGTGLDHDRLYVVEYISHSQAGFYMFEARVTSAVVLKVFYLSGIVLLSVASRVITRGDL